MMLGRRARVRGVAAGAALAVAMIAGGCAEDADPPVAENRVVGAAVEVAPVMRALSVAAGANPAPDTGVTRAANASVDARLLVITADGTNAALTAIATALDYLGTPYDVLNATTGPALTADTLATGDRGRYQGIVLDTGDLAVGASSAFTDAEWMALASYEARFGVRRAVLYAIPTPAYGLRPTGSFAVRDKPLGAVCTAAGSAVFVGANCAVPIVVTAGQAYSGEPTDASTVPLLVDAAGNVYAATRAYADGREALVLTFSQSPTELHTLSLVYGVVSWVTRGLFIGERHVYLSAQLDDFFLPSALYPASAGATYRSTAADLQALADWQNRRRADPVAVQLRSAFAFNAYGARPPGQDPLTDKARELGPAFTWINHTWDHKSMTTMAYAEAFEEFSKNNQYGIGSGLNPYSVENLVTPGITGIDNAEVMRAAYDVGIRHVVSDTSLPGQNNPSPNAGYYNALVGGLLMVPRRPTELYFNVSQPSEWVAEYNALYSGTASYEQIVSQSAETLVRYMLRGENDPWMFHQANIRDLGGGESLFSKLLGAVLDQYKARATFPVLCPTMDELAQRVRARMVFNASGARATIGPGAQLTVQVTSAATVPVTGLCTAGAEAYAGQQISYLQLAAGEAITVSTADCNDGVDGTGGGPAGGGGGGGSGGPTTGTGTRGQLTTDSPPATESSGCAVPGRRAAGGTATALAVLALALSAGRARRRRR
jgi:hypothetical protein